MDDCLPCTVTAASDASPTTATWTGVLGMEGQMTGDGRYIEHNALYWEDLPLPIRYVASDVGAHDGAQVVGRIINIWRGDGGQIMGEGDFDLDSDHGKEAMRQVEQGLTTGVSMDLDDVSFEVRMSSDLVDLLEADQLTSEENAEPDESGRVKVAAVKSDDEVRITTSGRIRAATIVAIPAFAEAKISLSAGGTMQTFGGNPNQARAPKGQKNGGQWIDTPGGVAAKSVELSGPVAEWSTGTMDALNEIGYAGGGWESAGGPNAVKMFETVDGEPRAMWITNDGGPDKWMVVESTAGQWEDKDLFYGDYGDLRKAMDQAGERFKEAGYAPFQAKVQAFADESKIDGAALAQAGEGTVLPPEFYRAVLTLQRCDEVEFLSDEYMALAETAKGQFQSAVDKGYDAAQEFVDALDAFLSINWTDLSVEDLKQPADEPMEAPDLTEPLLASVYTPSRTGNEPPRAWFRDPKLTEPTPLTVTDDGRVYGHLATWNTCHIGHSHNGCVKPPRSATNYAHFRVGATLTDDGSEVATGRITLETRHAMGTLNARQTLAHYEDTGRAVADVAAGEDRHGIWIAGCIRPGTPDDKIAALRGSPLSGDWRRIGGNLELVAALAVNVPGFPIPRPAGLVASGKVQSLVASGMLAPRRVAAPGTPNALSEDDLRYLKALAQRERRSEAEEMRLRVKTSQLAMKRKEFTLIGGR